MLTTFDTLTNLEASILHIAYTLNRKTTKEDNDMPTGPNGEKRPADVIGCAVHVAKIATGEIEDTKTKQQGKRKGGIAGSKARNATLSKSERSKIAKKAAAARWSAQA